MGKKIFGILMVSLAGASTNALAIQVTSFTLVNANNGNPVDGYSIITNGMNIPVATLPATHLSIQANVDATTESVTFQLDSNSATTQGVPAELCGYYQGVPIPCGTWANGSHQLTATPWSGPSATGTSGAPLTINFTVNGGQVQPSPTPSAVPSPAPSAAPSSVPSPAPSPSPTIIPPVSAGALPVGNAVWVYDLNLGTNMVGAPAEWASEIAAYNQGAVPGHTISTVYTYGGDFEYYPTASNPYQVYFNAAGQQAAQIYKSTYGVQNVIAVVDGVMNGGQSYSPDLSKLTLAQVNSWADVTAELYCSFDFIDGLQVDLEPAKPPYLANLTLFLARLSSDLMMEQNNCVDGQHPLGRSVSAFMFATVATPAIFQALGPNGYVTVSGYDLSSTPAGTPTDPATYQAQLTSAIQTVIANAAGTGGSFVIGIPGGASTHEFTQYLPSGQAAVNGYPMYSLTQPNYVTNAVKTVHALLAGSNQFLGTAVWGFSSQLSYPNGSGNLFIPSTPFQQAGEMTYLQNNL